MDDENYSQRVIHTLKNYQEDTINRMSYMQKVMSGASLKHKELLLQTGFGQYLNNLVNCVEENQSVLTEILQTSEMELESVTTEKNAKTYNLDYQRLISCLIQIVREWSEIGENERKICFQPILEELKSHFPEDSRDEIRILVPGCGLARLPFEIALEGFQCAANEQDLIQLMTASYIINACQNVDEKVIYPWIHDLSNRASKSEATKLVNFPDIDPSERPDNFQFDIIPGDFVEVSKEMELDESLDAVITTFFIETAQNPLKYLDAIAKILKPGGLWINFGSLNFVHEPFQDCISISLEVLKNIVKTEYKFAFLKDEIVQSTYGTTNCDTSRTKVDLNCCFFVCQKPEE